MLMSKTIGSTGETPVTYTCPATAGSKLTFEWRMWADLEQEGALDPSHKGPCAVYAKQVSNMSSTPAAGTGWFKLWEEGYNNMTGKWCTESLIDAEGLMSIQIPEGLPSGNFLFRPELLALHNADKGDPQFYTGCAQIQVQGSSAAALEVPAEYSVSIPGYVKAGDRSVNFDIYSPVFPYPMPGPSVYTVPSSSSYSSLSSFSNKLASSSSADTTAADGATLIPTDCLIKEANWCGVEVADYSTEDGCWAASEDCYSQAQVCYDSVPPTGNKNCEVWEAKCQGIQDACSSGTFSGPPNKGEQLPDAEVRTGVVVPVVDNLGTGEAGRGAAGSDTSGSVTVKSTAQTTAVATATASGFSEEATDTTATSSRTDKSHGWKTAAKAHAAAPTTAGASSSTVPCDKKARRSRRGRGRK